MFFFYCGIETTCFLWSSSYLNMHLMFSEELAASLACLFYGGMTLGRILSGIFSNRLKDAKTIFLGIILISLGLTLLVIDVNSIVSCIGLVIVGIGAGPIYPSIIHMSPDIFGKEKSQAIIGIEMAFAYIGNLVFPSLFGLIANHFSISFFPYVLAIVFIIMSVLYFILMKKQKENR